MDNITELLTRGVDTIYPSKEQLEKVLRNGKKLTLYQGFDPTGTQLHIGHMVGFRKLAQWQKLGHKVIFLIGTGTGLAGDPSGKLRAREKFLTEDELKQNAKDYVMQASKLVNFDGDNPIEIVYNGDWLNKLTLAEMLDIAGHFTVQQLIERDLFQERIKKEEAINLREFVYPLLQGYDSVALKVDLELGGTDQTFNMLAGRQLVKDYLGKEKFVMTTPLLTDSNGVKIGKSEGNVIALTDKPEDLFGKIMSLPDNAVAKAFEYLTDVPMEEIRKIDLAMREGNNPVDHKKRLAFEIVKQLNNEASADVAKQEFERVVQKKEIPVELHTYDVESLNILDILTHTMRISNSEARRLIEQGGVEVSGKKITDPKALITLEDSTVIKAGKRNFFKVRLHKQ